jgi:hypothetical protein
MSCEPDSQFRNRPHFVAVHESESGPSRQAAFFGPTVANEALRTWLDRQLAPPCRDWTQAV